jgi:hypothetical protein
MTVSETPTGTGLMTARSKITSPELLSVDAFTKWYNEIHVPDVLASSGVVSAFRYVTANPGKVERPYLAYYPLQDLGFLNSEEFRTIPVTSKTLPGSQNIFDLVDFAVGYHKLIKNIKGEANRKGMHSRRTS